MGAIPITPAKQKEVEFMRYINRDILAKMIYRNKKIPKTLAEEIVKYIFDEFQKTLVEDGEIDIAKFGKFYCKDRSPRKGINPNTGEEIFIGKRLTPKFKTSSALTNAINHRK